MTIPLRLSIRPMEASDLTFVRQGLSETNWQDIPTDQKAVVSRAACDRRIFEDFDRFLEDNRFKFKVFIAALSHGRRVGYISTGELSNPAVGIPLGGILDFWVVPEYRRRGIGTMLLEHALNHIRSQGYSHASILVSSSNKSAISLYEKRSFYIDRMMLVKNLKT